MSRRRSLDLIGTFEEEIYTGELTRLYLFRDLSFGDHPIGVKLRREFVDQIELGQTCHIKVEVRVTNKPLEDGSTGYRVVLDAYALEMLRPLPEEA